MTEEASDEERTCILGKRQVTRRTWIFTHIRLEVSQTNVTLLHIFEVARLSVDPEQQQKENRSFVHSPK